MDTKICENCGHEFSRDKRNTWAHWAKAKFCSRQCFGQMHAKLAAANRPPMAEVFSKWVDKSGDCWLWTGARDKDGYGIFSYARKSYRAPVIALELDGRPVPAGKLACHECDHPPCVNPAHLYPGTHEQNMADAVRRQRTNAGERCYAAKLTSEDVAGIRASDLSAPELASQYGVTRSNISMIKSGRTWRHVQ